MLQFLHGVNTPHYIYPFLSLLHPRKIPGTHFCYRLSRPHGHYAAGRISSIENSMNSLGIEHATLCLVA
jgi:hypothetical protein